MGFDYVRDASGIVTVTMDMDGQSANTMTAAYHSLMGQTVARLEAETDLTGVIITSAKKTFFAGGDLNGLYAAETGDAAYQAWLNEDKGFLRRLERLPVPVVAAINGAALGGGLEICLACNHRMIADDPRAVTGLPEVTLGLLPGAGGTSRLPRLIRLEPALELLLSGRTMTPPEALSLGVVDQIVAPDALLEAARHWITQNPAAHRQPWECGGGERDGGECGGAAIDGLPAAVAQARAQVLARTRGLLPAPLAILEIIEAGLALPVDDMLALETIGFAGLIGLPETRAAIWSTFLAANAIRSGKLCPRLTGGPVAVVTIRGKALEALKNPLARKVTVVDEGACDMVLSDGAGDLPQGGAVGVLHGAAQAGSGFRFALWPQQGVPQVAEVMQAGASDAEYARACDLFRRGGLTVITQRAAPQTYVQGLRAALAAERARLLAEGIAPVVITQAAWAAGLAETTDQGTTAPPEIGLRLVYAMALSALVALRDGAIRTAEEADMAAILGAGFPRHLGGPVQMLRGMGRAGFVAQAQALGPRFAADAAHLANPLTTEAPA